MQEFARGLVLEVPDREKFESFVSNNAHDPAVHFESWGDDSVPERLYIDSYTEDDHPYYRVCDEHVNNEVTVQYWDEELLIEAVDAGVLEDSGNYDTDFVDQHS